MCPDVCSSCAYWSDTYLSVGLSESVTPNIRSMYSKRQPGEHLRKIKDHWAKRSCAINNE